MLLFKSQPCGKGVGYIKIISVDSLLSNYPECNRMILNMKTGNDRKHKEPEQIRLYTDDQLSNFIDMAMNSMDKNRDGFITFNEFIRSEESQNRMDDLKANQNNNNGRGKV